LLFRRQQHYDIHRGKREEAGIVDAHHAIELTDWAAT